MSDDELDGWAAIRAGIPFKGVIIRVEEADRLTPEHRRRLEAFCERAPAVRDWTAFDDGRFWIDAAVSDVAVLDEIVAGLRAILPSEIALDMAPVIRTIKGPSKDGVH